MDFFLNANVSISMQSIISRIEIELISRIGSSPYGRMKTIANNLTKLLIGFSHIENSSSPVENLTDIYLLYPSHFACV